MLHNYIFPPFSIVRIDFYIFLSGISFFFPYIIPSSVFNSSSREEPSEEENIKTRYRDTIIHRSLLHSESDA